MTPRKKIVLSCSLVLCLVALACRSGGGSVPPDNGDKPAPSPEIQTHRHCPFGVPLITGDRPLGETTFIEHSRYVLEYSLGSKAPLWVSQYWPGYGMGAKKAPPITREANWAQQVNAPAMAGPEFRPDPALAPGQQASLTDYQGSGFDRGRLATPLHREPGREVTEETHYLTNVAPQVGTGFGREVWAELEDQVRRTLERRGEAWVITGCFQEKRRSPPTIGSGKVAVPSHFYKILISRSASGGWESVAFVFKNERSRKKTPEPEDYRRSINWIEKRTGVNFMPLLDDEQEKHIEGKVGEMWPSLGRL